ncbi:hypothetical protein Y032_0073g744 [Ancylostoma ceylanicum]|uniref:Uncharacterized protein n=1 Tax=Ancylostoma ceylanicum TaxID=53326 RepID=A0A016TVM7_9BILA|nr:hypothetical protein Y032_0073g744 [Ancylostoma ceylanicum]
MGQRLAPLLAIAFMAKIEAPVLESRPLLYCSSSDGLILFVFLRLVEGTKRRLDQTMLVGRLQFTLLRRASEATPTQLTYYSTNRRDDSSYPTKFCRKERNPQSPVV